MLIIAIFGFTLMACNRSSHKCNDAKCAETVPNEPCEAAFQNWFYHDATGTCGFVSYSGCNSYGFDSQEDCLACKCLKE